MFVRDLAPLTEILGRAQDIFKAHIAILPSLDLRLGIILAQKFACAVVGYSEVLSELTHRRGKPESPLEELAKAGTVPSEPILNCLKPLGMIVETLPPFKLLIENGKSSKPKKIDYVLLASLVSFIEKVLEVGDRFLGQLLSSPKYRKEVVKPLLNGPLSDAVVFECWGVCTELLHLSTDPQTKVKLDDGSNKDTCWENWTMAAIFRQTLIFECAGKETAKSPAVADKKNPLSEWVALNSEWCNTALGSSVTIKVALQQMRRVAESSRNLPDDFMFPTLLSSIVCAVIAAPYEPRYETKLQPVLAELAGPSMRAEILAACKKLADAGQNEKLSNVIRASKYAAAAQGAMLAGILCVVDFSPEVTSTAESNSAFLASNSAAMAYLSAFYKVANGADVAVSQFGSEIYQRSAFYFEYVSEYFTKLTGWRQGLRGISQETISIDQKCIELLNAIDEAGILLGTVGSVFAEGRASLFPLQGVVLSHMLQAGGQYLAHLVREVGDRLDEAQDDEDFPKQCTEEEWGTMANVGLDAARTALKAIRVLEQGFSVAQYLPAFVGGMDAVSFAQGRLLVFLLVVGPQLENIWYTELEKTQPDDPIVRKLQALGVDAILATVSLHTDHRTSLASHTVLNAFMNHSKIESLILEIDLPPIVAHLGQIGKFVGDREVAKLALFGQKVMQKQEKDSELYRIAYARARALGQLRCSYLKCATLGKHASKLCSACHVVRYCSPKCQKLDWKGDNGHKPACSIFVEEAKAKK